MKESEKEYYCELCDKGSNSELWWNKHVKEHMNRGENIEAFGDDPERDDIILNRARIQRLLKF